MHSLLKLLPPETAHKAAMWALSRNLGPQGSPDNPLLRARLFDHWISNPVMLGAGVSKNGEGLHGFSQMGFGGVEVGSLMAEKRTGNPHSAKYPRIIRLPDGSSIVNWLGLPSLGIQAGLANLHEFRELYGKRYLLGANFAPDSKTPDLKKLELLGRAYLILVQYFTLNKSCPNTEELANAVTNLPQELKLLKGNWPQRHVLVKLGPTPSLNAMWHLQDVAMDNGADGFVLLNTCPPELKDLISSSHRPAKWLVNAQGKEVGGYSGPGMFDYTLRVVEQTRKRLGHKPTLIATGAQNGHQAVRLLSAGANVLQTNTGITMHGMPLLEDIKQAIVTAGGTSRLLQNWPRGQVA
ncbi:MAG TPA: hypothetical protein VHP58_06315 [Alphaproteobacteria bacterium]|nr:hypothetical protein [Alphaproteobacteria bacterium]